MKKRGKNEKRAQAWGMDLMVAFVIFTIGIVIFYFYAINQPGEAEEKIDSLSYEGKIIGDSIFSDGYPENWDSSNVVTLGILSNNKINETKLDRFYNLASVDYSRTKNLFNTRFDYYFFLSENMTLTSGEVEGIGLPPSNPENLIRITRFTIYKDKPVTAHIYIWE